MRKVFPSAFQLVDKVDKLMPPGLQQARGGLRTHRFSYSAGRWHPSPSTI